MLKVEVDGLVEAAAAHSAAGFAPPLSTLFRPHPLTPPETHFEHLLSLSTALPDCNIPCCCTWCLEAII